MSESFYELLEVSQSASAAEIKKSYRQLARKYHPDNADTGDEERFKKIQAAYEVLSDAEKKQVYDQMGHEAFMSAGSRGPGAGGFYGGEDMFSQFEDIFSAFFGGGAHSRPNPNGPQRGGDLQGHVEIEFLEACFGLEKTIEIRRESVCNTCNGSGADPAHKPVTCTTCNGVGEVRQQTQSFLGTITQVSACPTCHGTGQQITHKCPECHGRRFEAIEEKLDVKIPAGIDNGMRIMLRHKGNDGLNGGPPGDYYLFVHVNNHAAFEREGLDIFSTINMDIAQAVLGDQIETETIHGQEPIEIQSGTQSATVLTLKGKGIHTENGRKGNHYLRLDLQVPNKKDISKELSAELEKLKGQDFKKDKNIFGF